MGHEDLRSEERFFDGSITVETTWNDQDGWATGGGVSDTFDLPQWQQNAGVPHSVNPGGRIGRGIPDVSGNADSATGYTVTLYGTTQIIGGTSAVAPLWSGLMALVNQSAGKHLGLITPQLYANASSGALRDIVTGSNAIPAIPPQVATAGYTASANWDACSGLGSPVGTALRKLLAGGRLMVADFSAGNPPVAVRYWEDYGNNKVFDGWLDPNDLHYVGDFMKLGDSQLLSINMEL